MMFSIDHMIVTCVTTVIFVKAMCEKKALKRVFINTFFWREENSKDEGVTSDGNPPSGSTTLATGRYIMCACLR